jgi:DNA-damage-inducible protein J
MMASKPQTRLAKKATAKKAAPKRAAAKTARRASAAPRKPAKTGYINARVEPKLKKSAAAVLDKIGLSTTDAVTMFLKQVVAQKGLPFPAKMPNRETVRAIQELERGGGTRHAGDTTALFEALLRPRKAKS